MNQLFLTETHRKQETTGILDYKLGTWELERVVHWLQGASVIPPPQQCRGDLGQNTEPHLVLFVLNY